MQNSESEKQNLKPRLPAFECAVGRGESRLLADSLDLISGRYDHKVKIILVCFGYDRGGRKMSHATVGQRYQVVIPALEREKLGIQAGDKVAVEVVDDHLELRVIDVRNLRGIGRELVSSEDPVNYVRELRAEWGTRT